MQIWWLTQVNKILSHYAIVSGGVSLGSAAQGWLGDRCILQGAQYSFNRCISVGVKGGWLYLRSRLLTGWWSPQSFDCLTPPCRSPLLRTRLALNVLERIRSREGVEGEAEGTRGGEITLRAVKEKKNLS